MEKNIYSKKVLAFSVVTFVSVSVFGGAFAEDNLYKEDSVIKTEIEVIQEKEESKEKEVLKEVEVKEEVKEEIKKEVKEEIKKEVKEEIIKEVKEEKETNGETPVKSLQSIKETETKVEVKSISLDIERLYVEGTSIGGMAHTIKADAISSNSLMYRFRVRDLGTGKWSTIQDYSVKNTASWIPRKKGNYWYGVDVKDVNSKADSDISKYVPIEIQPSIPAELHSLDIKGTGETRTDHTISASGKSVNGVLYRFYIKDESTGKWDMLQDYSEKNTVDWRPEKPGNYLYSVNVKDKNSWEEKEAQMSIPITVVPLKPAVIESLELKGSNYEKTNHTLVANAHSTNGVLYKFYIKDEATGKWTILQDYSEKNTVSWRPEKIGKYAYYVGVRDKRSENERDSLLSYGVSINPPVYYNSSNYGDTVQQAVDKQINVSGTKPQTSKGGKWVEASREEVESYLRPDRFLQFKPEGGTGTINKEGTVTTDGLNVRSGPGTSYGVIGKTNKGRVHQVISEKDGWYMISLDGIHGWISGSYIDFGEAVHGENKYLTSVEIMVSGLNVRQDPKLSSPSLTTVSNGKVYIVMEEKNGWFKINAGGKIGWVSGDYVKYVNDVPREMYQFMVLSGQAGVTSSLMNIELEGKGILAGKGAAFIEGSKKYNINELYLMAHAFLETGNGTSKLATGVLVDTVDGKPVEPRIVYNMYGIGAFDTAPLRGGSEKAYKEGWFTPEIAITEGAQWISTNYINNKTYKQDTLYKMKWNPTKPGTHQYATDIAWAFKQIKQIDTIMDYARRIEGVVLRFDIPVYK